jgi:3-oxoacid CoA-transferase subunit B
MPLSREQIAQRISKEIKDGFVVNLGIGIPTLVANYIPKNVNVMLHSENGLLGMGAFPAEKDVDADLINAGKQTVTAVPGASFFSSAESFEMIRGGHINLTVLGAMQVDIEGSIANWMVPGKMIKGMGGAMDLVAGAQRVVVAMQHVDRSGEKKLLKKCTLPLTGVNCFDLVVTDYGVFTIKDKKFILHEKAEDISVEEIINSTEGPVEVSPSLKDVSF